MGFCSANSVARAVASWNDQLSACQSRLLTLSPYPHLRPNDSDPVLTDAQPSPWPAATPYPDVRPQTPPPSVLLDRELQEAFQECEEQMASLGILNSTTPETFNNVGEKTGEVMVNKSSESSSLPPIVAQPGHSNGGHGNKNTHGNSEAANTQKDTVVFSFRNYILGTGNSAELAESEIKATQSLDKRPEMKPEKESGMDKQKGTPTHTQLETTTESFKEAQKDAAFTERRDDHVGSDAATEGNGSPDGNTVIREEGTEAITVTADIKKENYSHESSINVCKAETHEIPESIHLHLKDKDALSETETGANNQTEGDQESKTDKWMNPLSDKEAEQDKKAKKKEKKRQRKKKKNAETELRETTVVRPASDSEAASLIKAGNQTDSNANTDDKSMPQADTQAVICREQSDNGFDYQQQLTPGGKPGSSAPLSLFQSRQDHLTDSACSAASVQALPQRPHQSENRNRTEAPCGMNQCSDETPQREHHATGGVIDDQNTPVTHVQPTVINQDAATDKISDAQTQGAIVTSEAAILTQENRSPLSSSRTCVGESGVESALEEALLVVAALPLTTPTLPEVIESEGEGESVRSDSLVRVASVAIAEAVGEEGLGGIEKCLSSAVGEKEGLLDSLPQLSLICSQAKCSLAFSAKEGQAASEESCGSKMPHNSAETDTKGPGETAVRFADAEISPAEEGAREKEPLRLEAYINTSPLGLLTGPDCQDHCAAGSEGGGGGGEEVEKKGGLAKDHSSFSQPEGSASGVSSAETESCPPTDVAESQLKPQSWSEPIAAVTESICTEKDRLSHPCQEQHGAAISPLPTYPEQSSSSANRGLRGDLNPNLISGEESSGHTREESSITETNSSQVFLSSVSPQASLQQIPVEQQASNYQQVHPESSKKEARTAESASELKVQTQTQSSRGSPAMSGVGGCDSSRRNNRVHFADEQESRPSLDLRNMTAMDCASLPPLTVHESLHHPVVEACYTFPDFLSLKKPEIPSDAAPAKGEAALWSPAVLPDPKRDIQVIEGDKGTKDTKESIEKDQSGDKNLETNTVDNKDSSNQLPCPNEKDQTDNKGGFVLSQTAGSAVSETDHLSVEEVETEKGIVNLCLSKEKQIDKLPLIGDASVVLEGKEGNQLLSSYSVLPAKDVTCKPVNDESPVGQLSTDLDPSLTCTASPQIIPSDPDYLSPSQLDQTAPCGLVAAAPMTDGEGSTAHSADLTKEGTASDQSIPVTEQSASNPTLVLMPPGPMLSHLEFITDCDVSLPERAENRGADGDIAKVSRDVDANKSRGVSFAQDLKQEDVHIEADKTGLKFEDRNLGINNINIPLSQEENLSLPTQPPDTKVGSDDVFALSHSDPDSTAIKPVICEGSIKDDLINVSCPLSPDLPTNQAHDEIEQDNVKGKHRMGDQTSVLFDELRNDNQKETADSSKQQTGKTTSQESHGPDKETVEEIRDVPPPHTHKVHKSESPVKDIKEEGESQREMSSLSPDRPTGSSEDMTSAEVEFGSEPQTVYDPSLCQTPAATLEPSSDRDTAPHLSVALGQSQSTPDPKCFAQQQEQQQQQRLESRHPTEEMSGGCREGGGKPDSQVRRAQALVPVIKGVAEGGDGSVGSLCQSGNRDDMSGDDSGGNERVIGLEKGEGARDAPGHDGVYVPSDLANDLNESGRAAERNASADMGILTSCSHVGDTRQGMDENKSAGLGPVGSATDLMPDIKSVSDLDGKGQQKSDLSAACQSKPENSAVSVESASQERETPSKVSTDNHDIHTEVFPRANQAGEIRTKVYNTLPDPAGQPETVEKDFSAAMTLKRNSTETDECEIQDTVCEPLEPRSSSVTSASQSSSVAQRPIKGPDVEEITKEDKAAIDRGKASSQGKGQNEIKGVNNEEREKQEVVNQTGSAKDGGLGSIIVSDLCERDTETTVCHSDGKIGPSKAAENDMTDKITPDVVTVPSVASSKHKEDFASTPQPAAPRDQASNSQDDVAVKPTVAASQCEGRSRENSPVQQVSECPATGPTAQEPDTNWIKALKEAASSHSQSKQENRVEASR